MTVEQLIEHLKTMPQDKEVSILNKNQYSYVYLNPKHINYDDEAEEIIINFED